MLFPMRNLSMIFERAIEQRTFPGGVVWLAQGDRVAAHAAFGTTAYEAEFSRPVVRETVYDIASLTKLFTTTAFLIAARSEGVDYGSPIARFFPVLASPDKSEITLRHLMQHNSGIEIAIQNLIDVPVDDWLHRIAAVPLHAVPGERVLYSCTNYFLLGRIVEQLSGQPLDQFIQSQLLRPLGMTGTFFHPLEELDREEIAPTEVETENVGEEAAPWQGIVHDEAARAVERSGGACGNAGLFSTATDLSKFAQLWLDGGAINGNQIVAEADIQRALTDVVDDGTAQRGLGWQIGARFYTSHLAPAGSAGHAGFTGPTFWLNPRTRHVAIVLNNRVYPTRNGLDRMPYHRRIAEWLMRGTS